MISELIKRLDGEADKTKAARMKAYMMNNFEFYGISAPMRKSLTADFIRSFKDQSWDVIIDVINQLWEHPCRECQYIAMDLFSKHLKKIEFEDIGFIKTLITTKSWWDTVDWLGGRAVGGYIKKFPDQKFNVVNELSMSGHMWLIRSAIIHQLFYKEETDKDLLAALVLEHMESKEFFVNKASGWALRQYSKVNGPWVSEFIDFNYLDLSPLTRKEGMRWLDSKAL